jgi:hypothetical protein
MFPPSKLNLENICFYYYCDQKKENDTKKAPIKGAFFNDGMSQYKILLNQYNIVHFHFLKIRILPRAHHIRNSLQKNTIEFHINT